MNFKNKIESYLISDDPILQEFVSHAIHDYPNVEEEWIEQLLNEAKEKPEKAPSILVYLPVKSVGEKIVDDLVDGVKNAPVNIRHLYGQLLFDVDPELVLKRREELTPYFPNDYLELYEVLVDGTEEDVWEQYGDILAKLEQEPYIDTNLYQKAKKIAYTLVKKDYITIEELERDFADNLKEKYFDYNGILTVYMFSLMKVDKYLAELADLLLRDEDILSEEVAATLISFQTNEVVEAVKAYIVKEESNIFASSIVENIKTGYAVEVLKDAYNQVDDEDMKATIFEALCHQLSPAGESVINNYVNDRPTSFLIDIEQVAYSYYKILNIDHPLMDEWKKELQSRDAEEEMIPEEPITSTKVGRNEPCPCGSGKKYKKCCGK